jgi:chromosome condensin MukBEF MukE localization factor
MRRLLWLTVGAGLGISGYRRASRIVGEFTRAGSAARRRQRAEALARFARDVREGMDVYAEQQRLNIERRRASAAPTLGSHQVTATSTAGEAGAGYQGHPPARIGSPAPRARH